MVQLASIIGRLAQRITPVNAKICLDDDRLVAELPGDVRLSHTDAIVLADMLRSRGVTVAEVFMLDWHEDPVRAPTSGQKIAVYQRLRLLEQSNV